MALKVNTRNGESAQTFFYPKFTQSNSGLILYLIWTYLLHSIFGNVHFELQRSSPAEFVELEMVENSFQPSSGVRYTIKKTESE